jgi:hypothetical protein
MKIYLVILISIMSFQVLALETNTDCPMMRESNQRENVKTVKMTSSKKMGTRTRTSAQ